MADDPPVDESAKRTAERPRSNLALRVLSSLVLAPVALAAAYVGSWFFAAFWVFAGIAVFVEWTEIVGGQCRHRVRIVGVAAIGAATLLISHPLFAAPHRHELSLLVLALGMIAAAALATSGKRLWGAGGVAYAGAIALAPIILRTDPSFGFLAIIVIFAVVWATDILAYFVGRAFGGAKLAVSISPKKTWSGAVGGTTGAVLAILAIGAYAHLNNSAILALIAVILSVVSQAGDLCESAIKRQFGVKDASQIIPGHGGVMDRLDGFVAAAAMATIIGVARGGFDAPGGGLLVW